MKVSQRTLGEIIKSVEIKLAVYENYGLLHKFFGSFQNVKNRIINNKMCVLDLS